MHFTKNMMCVSRQNTIMRQKQHRQHKRIKNKIYNKIGILILKQYINNNNNNMKNV